MAAGFNKGGSLKVSEASRLTFLRSVKFIPPKQSSSVDTPPAFVRLGTRSFLNLKFENYYLLKHAK